MREQLCGAWLLAGVKPRRVWDLILLVLLFLRAMVVPIIFLSISADEYNVAL